MRFFHLCSVSPFRSANRSFSHSPTQTRIKPPQSFKHIDALFLSDKNLLALQACFLSEIMLYKNFVRTMSRPSEIRRVTSVFFQLKKKILERSPGAKSVTGTPQKLAVVILRN